MKITLHIGVPKTGSTAIQAHLALNRGWFDARKIVIPTSGFSDGFGHVLLFEDTSNVLLNQLRDELTELKASGAEHALISWEGLNMFNQTQVENVGRYLAGHEVTVLAYLRDQTEVIQSGYLQAIKQRRQRRTLEDYQQSELLLKPWHINYDLLLGRYASVFGAENIVARVYERQSLHAGNIVIDFLDALGLSVDDTFILAKSEQNISLDVGSACLLNTLDSLYSDTDNREALVDLLLARIAAVGPDQKYFLPRDKVSFIRSYFAASNNAVMEKYDHNKLPADGLFPQQKGVAIADVDVADLAAEKLAFLGQLKKYHAWRGEHLQPSGLIKLTSQDSGWSTVEDAGVWSSGKVSYLKFRILRSVVSPFAKFLKLRLRGQYFHQNKDTRVSAEGFTESNMDLTDALLHIPLNSFDEYGCIDLKLLHHAPVSPHEIGMHEDSRELAYMLQSAEFDIDV